MECVMGIANEIVDDIRRECGWSTEQLAEACGYSRTQTNYFCNGGATPPSEFLARLFELTLDVRVPKLNTGRVPCGVVIKRPRPLKDLSDQATLNRLITRRQEQLDEERALLKLLENGIDPTDPKEWQRYKRWLQEFDESITAQFDVHQAINAMMNDARRRTGSNGQAVTPTAFVGGQT